MSFPSNSSFKVNRICAALMLVMSAQAWAVEANGASQEILPTVLPSSMRYASLMEELDHTHMKMVFDGSSGIENLMPLQVQGDVAYFDLPADTSRLDKIHLTQTSRIRAINSAFDGQNGRLVLSLRDHYEVERSVKDNVIEVFVRGPSN